MLAMASPSFVISKFKSSIIFFGVNFDNAWSLNLRLMRTLGVERSSAENLLCFSFNIYKYTCSKEPFPNQNGKGLGLGLGLDNTLYCICMDSESIIYLNRRIMIFEKNKYILLFVGNKVNSY